MEAGSKYFSKTIAALGELKASTELLESNAELIVNKNKELDEKISVLRKQIVEKAARVEMVIQNLGKVVK